MMSVTSQKIGVLMGGFSTERAVSLKSGQAILESLRRQGYQVIGVDVDRQVAEKLAHEKIELAVMALHGRWGEDGTIQGLLEIMGIPYSGSGVMASAVGMNKVMTKRILESYGLPTPRYQVLDRSSVLSKLPAGFDLPVVIKPATQGSTVGVSIVSDGSQVEAACEEAFKYDPQILMEEYIAGREIAAGILDHEPLPLVEVIPKEKLYDYKAKYTSGMSTYVVPADMSKEKKEEIQAMVLKCHQAIGCEGCTRSDLRLTDGGNPYILEINTVPGMTKTSLIPKAALAAGMDYDALVARIVKGTLDKTGAG